MSEPKLIMVPEDEWLRIQQGYEVLMDTVNQMAQWQSKLLVSVSDDIGQIYERLDRLDGRIE